METDIVTCSLNGEVDTVVRRINHYFKANFDTESFNLSI